MKRIRCAVRDRVAASERRDDGPYFRSGWAALRRGGHQYDPRTILHADSRRDAHASRPSLRAGNAASPELRELAEEGSTDPFITLLRGMRDDTMLRLSGSPPVPTIVMA